MRGLKSTIALIVVLAGLGAYIYFGTWKQPEAGADTGKKQDKAFAGLESRKIGEVKGTSAAGDAQTLTKRAGGWRRGDCEEGRRRLAGGAAADDEGRRG